jgi:hypothetical protein
MGLIKFAKIVYEQPEPPKEFTKFKDAPEGKGFLDVFSIILEPDIPNDIMFLGREKDIPKVINKYYPGSTFTVDRHNITEKTTFYKNPRIIFDIDDDYKIKFKKCR